MKEADSFTEVDKSTRLLINKINFHSYVINYTIIYSELTCMEVTVAAWPCSIHRQAVVCRHQMRIILSQLPDANSVFS